MKKIFLSVIFIIFCAAQLFILVNMIVKVYIVKNNSIEVKFRCTAYDPYNPIQGRFIRLSFFNEENINIKSMPSLKNLNENNIKKLINNDVYCIVSGNNYSPIIDITYIKPGIGANYFKAKVKNVNFNYDNKYGDSIFLEFPFNKYFIQEDLATAADKILRDREKSDDYYPTLLVNIDSNGNYVVKKLLIKDKPVEDFIKSEYKK